MKKICIAIAVTSALLLCLVAGSAFFAKSAMEDVVRETLAGLAGPDSETAAGSVVFSPLTREITVVDWSSMRRGPDGPGTMHADTMRGTVSFRGIIACLPGISSLVMNDDSVVPLVSRLTVTGLRYEKGGSRGEIARIAMERIAMPFSLLRQYLAGNRPPFAQACAGVQIEKAGVENYAVSSVSAAGSSSLSFKKADISGLTGCSFREAVVTDGSLSAGGQPVTAARAVFRDVRIGPALLSEILALSSDGGSAGGNLTGFAGALQENGPMLKTAAFEGMAVPFGASSVSIKKTDVEWKSVNPMTAAAHIRGAAIPGEAVDRGLGLKLAGMRTVEADVDLSSTGLAQNRQQGFARFRGLCDLSWDFTYLPAQYAVRDASVTLRDYTLTAEIARNITPDAHAAAMVLKVTGRGLCSGDQGSGRSECSKLESFIDAPGTITLSTHRGAVLTLPQAAGAFLMNQLGSVVNISVTPGPQTLTQAVDALSARGSR